MSRSVILASSFSTKATENHRVPPNVRFEVDDVEADWTYVISESLFPLLCRELSTETCLGTVHSLDMLQSSLCPFKQAILTPKS